MGRTVRSREGYTGRGDRSTPPIGHHAPRCSHCRKRTYPSRRLAKRARRLLNPSKPHEFDVYPCRAGGQGWHLGHPDPRFNGTSEEY